MREERQQQIRKRIGDCRRLNLLSVYCQSRPKKVEKFLEIEIECLFEEERQR
jgi:hypothetical protein